jgi:hypothetical protein
MTTPLLPLSLPPVVVAVAGEAATRRPAAAAAAALAKRRLASCEATRMLRVFAAATAAGPTRIFWQVTTALRTPAGMYTKMMRRRWARPEPWLANLSGQRLGDHWPSSDHDHDPRSWLVKVTVPRAEVCMVTSSRS